MLTGIRKISLTLASLLACSALLPNAAHSVVPPKGGDAIISNLATEALLLGVTRAGSRIVAVGEYGNILLSDDDGQTWQQARKVPTTATLTSVFFVNDKTGWAVGHDTIVLKTEDAGSTWVKQFGGGESDSALLSVFFKDASHGWAIGAFNYTIETTDAGKTWTERKTLVPVKDQPAAPKTEAPAPDAALPTVDDRKTVQGLGGRDPYAAATGDENHLNFMFAGPDPDTLFVAAEAGAVYRSVDGGANWQKILSGYVGSFWGGFTAKDRSIYVCGMRGNIWRSTDKGLTWKKMDTSNADQSIASGLQLPDGSMVFVGLGGQVLYSTDGQKFTLTYSPDRKGLNAVIQDGKSLLVFGEAGVRTQSTTPLPEEIDVPLPTPTDG